MDMQRLNNFCSDTLNSIFKDIVPIKKDAVKYERFFGGAFSNGHVEYINSITNALAVALLTIVSQNIGAKKYARVKKMVIIIVLSVALI
jgi:hypothetical protein